MSLKHATLAAIVLAAGALVAIAYESMTLSGWAASRFGAINLAVGLHSVALLLFLVVLHGKQGGGT